MNARTLAVPLLLLLAACATSGAAGGGKSGGSSRFLQADHRLPEVRDIDEEAERQALQDARNYLSRGQQAQQSGNMDQARAEWATAGEQFGKMADKFPTSDWHVVFRYTSARSFLWAQRFQDSALNADKVVGDPGANDASKALAAHLAFAAWQQQAVTDARAGKVEGLRFPEQRKDKPLAPRSPPGAWKQAVAAGDQYLKLADADPDLKKAEAERSLGSSPAQTALFGAQVEYAFDNVEDARGRAETILQRWPHASEVLDDAVALYLNTYLIQNDQIGYRGALDKVQGVIPELEKSQDPKAHEAAVKLKADMEKFRAGTEFTTAKALLDQGKAAEAAQAFEQIAERYASATDVASALFNAAVAWNKANEPAKAAADVEQILTKYPTAKVAPTAMLMMAQARSKAKDHAGASQFYEKFLSSYPDAPNRCLALQNVGYEAAEQGKKADAAARYLAFGKDAACVKEDPNNAAKALFLSGKLFTESKQKAKAREAFEATVQVQGVTDVVAKSQIDDARQRLKAK